jgi:chromosome partitioning protein
MFRVLVANSKGGSGKTTLTSNVAGYFARSGKRTALIDCDPQGSSLAWCGLRGAHLPPIHAIPGEDPVHGLRGSWLLRLPTATEAVVIDTPAGLRSHEFAQFARHADVLLIPIVPSAIDLRATLAFIDLVGKQPEVRQGVLRLGLVANRLRERTLAARTLDATLERLTRFAVARVRDSQVYVGHSATGLTVFDDNGSQSRAHREDWAPLVAWLEARAADRAPRGTVTPLAAARRPA